jgi:polygalacturonase
LHLTGSVSILRADERIRGIAGLETGAASREKGMNFINTAVNRRRLIAAAGLLVPFEFALANTPDAFNVRKYGAKGDGRTLDTNAIQKAINAASAAGGGTVYFPKGRYLSFSVQLKSHVTIYFGTGAVLVAADPAKHHGRYNSPEPNPHENYQDFGHSYFRNSLLWGENVEDITLIGPGMIDGEGLTNKSPNAPWSMGVGRDLPQDAMLQARIADLKKDVASMNGLGNKAIALKNSRNITMRDFTIFRGGHFGILATGVDNLTIDNLKIDTNRDGIDVDVVRNCRISNCSVNSPTDDAIVLKSSYALGEARPTENVTITNCFVSGYAVGSLLDGTYKREQLKNIDPHLTSGRIKLGTESTGGFRNIAVSNCVFDCCNGLAIESVDGAVCEDVVVENLVMRDTTYCPIFVRLGDRRRAPPGAPMAVMRRVSISNIDCQALDRRYCSEIVGVPGGLIEDVSINDVRFVHPGGGTAEWAALKPPENADKYPDPDMFGVLPAWGFFLRHAKRVMLHNVEVSTLAADARPVIVTDDVTGLRAESFVAANGLGTPFTPVQI